MREIGLYPVKRPGLPIREQIHLIAQAGFDYVCASSIRQLTEAGADGLVAACAREHLPVDNVHLSGADTNLVWLEGAAGKAIIERYCQEMTLAVNAGVRLGVVHVTWGLEAPPMSELGLKRFERLAAFAKKIGFIVGFENSVSTAHLEAVLARCQGAYARFCFDSGHWNAFAPGTDFPHTFAKRMCITHLQDNDRQRDLHLIPFDGCVPYADVADDLCGMDRLTMEAAGVVRCQCPGQSREEIAKGLSRLAIADDPALVKVTDGGFSVYEDLPFDVYLQRMLAAGRRLRCLIEQKEQAHV